MTTTKKYLNLLRECEPHLWKNPLEESTFTDQDLSVIEQGLGYCLPTPYREFLLSYKMPEDITVLVSFCGDSFANSWGQTFSREQNTYVSRPEFDIGPTVEFEWHNITGDSGKEFLENLIQQQGVQQDEWPCFLKAGFIQLGNVYGYLTFLDLVNGGIVTIHEEGVYDMLIDDGVNWESAEEIRKYMESRLYICKDFGDFLRFVCTGDFLDEDEAKFPTEEELERDYSY